MAARIAWDAAAALRLVVGSLAARALSRRRGRDSATSLAGGAREPGAGCHHGSALDRVACAPFSRAAQIALAARVAFAPGQAGHAHHGWSLYRARLAGELGRPG